MTTVLTHHTTAQNAKNDANPHAPTHTDAAPVEGRWSALLLRSRKKYARTATAGKITQFGATGGDDNGRSPQ